MIDGGTAFRQPEVILYSVKAFMEQQAHPIVTISGQRPQYNGPPPTLPDNGRIGDHYIIGQYALINSAFRL